MARRPASRRAQRGVALLGLLAVAVMVFAYVLTSRLNAASQFVGIDRDDNAKALAQAKRALIGWMAINAATDNNPGRLPCPEAVNAIGTNAEGISAPLVTPSTPNCATVGRLPWRTLGLEKLVDAASEPLWYAVSPGWALQNSFTLLSRNSDSWGAMVIDGQAAPNEVVALIIAPGPAMNVVAASGCTAQAQTRAAPAPAMNPANYIECFDAATPAFSTTGPATSFNDQVVRVTVADLMPALEAAIADRMQREFAPALKTAVSTLYTSTQYSGIPAGVPLYPYPVPFANPTTSGYVGASGASNPQGLLPFNQINSACSAPQPCTLLPVAGTVSVTGGAGYGGSLDSYNCSSSATELLCTGRYREDGADPSKDVRIEMAAMFSDVAMGFRVLASNPLSLTLAEARNNGSTGAWLTPSTSLVDIKMNDGSTTLPDGTPEPKGSVTFRIRATLPNIDDNGWGTIADFRIRIQRSVFSDHFLLNADPSPVTNPQGAATSWFVRNQWYRNTYYAVHKRYTADLLGTAAPDCSTNPSDPAASRCLRFNDDTYNIRALLVLAGRRLDTQTRHNNIVQNYLEHENGDGDDKYEQRRMRMSKITLSPAADPYYAPWNDRIILVDWDPGSPLITSQVVSLTPLRVVTLP